MARINPNRSSPMFPESQSDADAARLDGATHRQSLMAPKTRPPEHEFRVSESNLQMESLLRLAAGSDQLARRALIECVYRELCQLAGAILRKHRDEALTSVELVHEVALRLLMEKQIPVESSARFFAYCSRVMSNLIIDRARRRDSLKRRGESTASSLLDQGVLGSEPSSEIRALREEMERLLECAPRRARILELRYLHGLSNREVAQTLGVSTATVKRDLVLAREWLRTRLCHDE